jgi:hypothetical protein
MDNVERIKFERTGGFAGMRIAADIELDGLPGEQATALTELLDELDFDELPEQLVDSEAVSDGFTYSITVESRKIVHTVTLGETSATEKMQELLQMLNRIARSQMRKQDGIL